ncbi:hypothetical protein MTZ49_07255 [Entomomonas sp. E2T0]|uniref:hypothetical protein n=1 Tax=Entomomonas sp. E2T0 TaxID=2930213 RepID=UPI0022284E75|nr:hypothetical protein [Entomomonas sp. E2T0]UYZ85336.1 hypothetical protein MTZ49_07255 [Entomomonas sp. E2T0]
MKVIDADNSSQIVVNNTVTKQPHIVMAGIRGAAGKDGSGEVLTATAGVNISALKVVYVKTGKAYQLDSSDSDNIFFIAGIAVTGAMQNNPIKIKRQGELTDQSFNFTLGRVYLGVEGTLTQTPLNKGYCVLIGTAIADKTILLNIQDPIEL